jgi:signal transduction histidine kinase
MKTADEQFGRQIITAFAVGILVAGVDALIDFSFARLGIATDTNILNDLLIGAAAAAIAYVWVSRQAAEQARKLSKEKIRQQAIDEERKRIALELHDSVSQDLTGIVLQLECAGDSLNDKSTAREHLHGALRLARRSLAEMRCALWDICPDELQSANLGRAIERLSKDLTAGTSLGVRCSLTGMARRLPPDIEKNLLRISQEALSNVIRHAQAHQVQIELSLDAQQARLCVKDDGRGFATESAPESFGLTFMKDRARALGGVWWIRSELGHGTEVHAAIPIPPENQYAMEEK